MAKRLQHALQLELPASSRACLAGAVTLLWAGPDRFNLLQPAAAAIDPAQIVGDTGTVIDLSGGQVILGIAGPAARSVLAKLVAIDLHPQSFRPGGAAGTLLGHFGVTLWQTDETPTYCMSCARSFAEALWHAVERAATAEGI